MIFFVSDFGLRIDGLSRNIKNREHASCGETCGLVRMMIGPILIGNCRRLLPTIQSRMTLVVHPEHSQWPAKLRLVSNRMLSIHRDQSESMTTSGGHASTGGWNLGPPRHPQRLPGTRVALHLRANHTLGRCAKMGLYINHMYCTLYRAYSGCRYPIV